MISIPSYASPVNISHKSVQGILDGQEEDIIVQEKIDGSQISFGVIDGELQVRSRGCLIHVEAPDNMFSSGVSVIKEKQDKLLPNHIYRGEYLKKPKHNVLAYDRVPKGLIVLFDVEVGIGTQSYLSQSQVEQEAERLGFDYAPVYHIGRIGSLDLLRDCLSRLSILGGSKIEGVVVKNYGKFTADHKVMMGKFVSEDFKEIHQQEWKKENPTPQDVKEQLILSLRTPARFNKAVQHLMEAGTLTHSTKDIGPLIKEVGNDIEKEEKDFIMQKLYEQFWPDIKRGVVYGVPEWYKEYLLKESLNEPSSNDIKT